MRLLIAEDDLTTRTVLAGVLTKEGHVVTVAADGAEAWLAFQQPDAPSLAIIDWMMPDLDGLSLVRRVRAVTTDRPPYLIMLSSRDQRADLIAGLAAGANDYLTKPFDAGELLARVEVGRRMLELQEALSTKLGELRLAFEQIKTLRGIVPICSFCKQVRDDQGYWKQVEVYVSEHSQAEFSHALCPKCIKEHYPNLD